MQKILVTICNYNHSKYLKESIQSIQNQTYDNLDICIVDDGSDDVGTVQDIVNTLKNQDNRIRYIELDKNRGKWNALNTAIKSTNAQICTAHDADDISLPQRIELQHRCMKINKSFHNLCGFHHCYDESDVKKYLELGPITKPKQLPHMQVTKLVYYGAEQPNINHYYTGAFETAGVSAMFHKQIWSLGTRFNPPNANLRVLLSEDSDFNFRVTTLFNKTSVIAEKLYLYRRNTSTNKEQF
jgi:glycosyltransferase involved in cell wall biosynthesis